MIRAMGTAASGMKAQQMNIEFLDLRAHRIKP